MNASESENIDPIDSSTASENEENLPAVAASTHLPATSDESGHEQEGESGNAYLPTILETETADLSPGSEAASAHRPATLEEAERAWHACGHLSEDFAKWKILQWTIQCQKDTDEEERKNDSGWPLVVHDFSGPPPAHDFILMPPGVYTIPRDWLSGDRTFIGLAWESRDYPTLLLEGRLEKIANSETGVTTSLKTLDPDAHFACVRIDAAEPTVIEVTLYTNQIFSEYFGNVEFGENVDALSLGFIDESCMGEFLLGRSWALRAYGSEYRKCVGWAQFADTCFGGVMKGVDAVFKPLVDVAGKIDRLFGLS
jgi:hypothetical protein